MSTGKYLLDFLKDHSAFIVRVKQSQQLFLGYLTLKMKALQPSRMSQTIY
jgi:hypothetical protein